MTSFGKQDVKRVTVKISVKAHVVAKITGKQLTDIETFETSFPSDPVMIKDMQSVWLLAEAHARMTYIRHVVDTMREDIIFKRRIGGTQWTVKFTEFSMTYGGQTYYVDLETLKVLQMGRYELIETGMVLASS